MYCLKIVWPCSTVRPLCIQRSVKYGTENSFEHGSIFEADPAFRYFESGIELTQFLAKMLMVTCSASRVFFAAWLLAFPKSFRGDEWSIKIFSCAQNFTFARLDDLLAKFKRVLACSCSHVFVRIRKQRSQEEQPYRTLLYRHKCFTRKLDCKTVRIFAYSNAREQSNVWNEAEARGRLSRHALPISLLILRKKPTVLQSTGKYTTRKNYIRDPSGFHM